MALDDRDYIRNSSFDNKKPVDIDSVEYPAYEDYLKDNGFIPDDGKRNIKKEPDLSGTEFVEDGSLNLSSTRKPIVEVDGRDRVQRELKRRKVAEYHKRINSQSKDFSTTEKLYRKPPGYVDSLDSKKDNGRPSALVYVFVFILLIFVVSSIKPASPKASPVSPPVSTTSDIPSSFLLPNTGVMSAFYAPNNNLPPFTFSVPVGSPHYFFKLRDVNTNQVVLTAFCRSGETFKTFVPFGDYRLDYAYGNEWRNEVELFGSSTVIRRADDVFRFYFDGSVYRGHIITMQLTPDGNLHSSYIPKSSF